MVHSVQRQRKIRWRRCAFNSNTNSTSSNSQHSGRILLTRVITHIFGHSHYTADSGFLQAQAQMRQAQSMPPPFSNQASMIPHRPKTLNELHHGSAPLTLNPTVLDSNNPNYSMQMQNSGGGDLQAALTQQSRLRLQQQHQQILDARRAQMLQEQQRKMIQAQQQKQFRQQQELIAAQNASRPEVKQAAARSLQPPTASSATHEPRVQAKTLPDKSNRQQPASTLAPASSAQQLSAAFAAQTSILEMKEPLKAGEYIIRELSNSFGGIDFDLLRFLTRDTALERPSNLRYTKEDFGTQTNSAVHY
jgi:hypothetical protein